MAITSTPRVEVPPEGAPSEAAGERPDRSFLRWGVGAHLVGVVALAAAIVAWLGGTFVYVLDDAAIHLSMAERLAHDGTWGVVPGQFESASSSPLWTVLVATGVAVAGPASAWVPLVLNAVAGVGVVAVLAAGQSVIRPGRARPLDAVATVVLVVVVLFLPGLAVVGMEHTLHVALVLLALLGVHRWALDRPGWPAVVTYGAVALASLARFETAFVALGLAAALVLADRRRLTGRAVGVLAASAVPIAGFAVLNRALGGGWLPNSVLAKGQGPGQLQDDATTPLAIVGRAATDPLVVVLLVVAAVYVIVRGRRAPASLPAVVLLVATGLHMTLADVGWYERYQAYLLAIGVYLVLAVLAELPAAVLRRAVVAVCVIGIVAGVPKLNALAAAPRGADDMYRQQYAAGRFLERFYEGEAVATDQLGYISLFHEGPLTDFAGLGDYEVLLRRDDGPTRELWTDLTAERGFRVVVLYDKAAAFNAPRSWIEVGSWRIRGNTATGVSRELVFFATTPEEVAPLQDHLSEYEAELPARSTLHLNEGADLRAMALAIEQAEGGDAGGDGGADAAPTDTGAGSADDPTGADPTGGDSVGADPTGG